MPSVQQLGIIPESNTILNNLQKSINIFPEAVFKNSFKIKSVPQLLLFFRDFTAHEISSSVNDLLSSKLTLASEFCIYQKVFILISICIFQIFEMIIKSFQRYFVYNRFTCVRRLV